MLSLQALRHDPATAKAALAKRGKEGFPAAVDQVLSVDEERRQAIAQVEELKARRNEVSKEIGAIKREGGDAEGQILEMRAVGDEIGDLDAVVSGADERIRELLLGIPNLPFSEVPPGGEEDNVLVRSWGEPTSFPFQGRPHWELGESLGILDLPRGAKVSGSGFPLLRGREPGFRGA